MKRARIYFTLLISGLAGCTLTSGPQAAPAPQQRADKTPAKAPAAKAKPAVNTALPVDANSESAGENAAEVLPKEIFSPAHAAAQVKIGGNPEEALKDYREILRQEPNSEAAQRNVALLLQNKGDLTGAEAMLREMISAHPDNEWAYNTLIVLLRERNDIEAAEAVLRQALAVLPEGLQLLNQQASIAIARDDLADGERIALAILKKDEKNTMAMLNLGNIYYKQKKYELASFAADNVISIDPKNAAAYNLKAFVRWAAGATKEALYFLKEASSLQPDNPTILLNTSQLLRTEGDAEQGLELIKRAYGMRPDDPNIILELGNAYRFTGDYVKALEYYRLVQEKDPTNVAVVYNLGLLYFDNEVEDLTLIPKITRALEYLNAYLEIAQLDNSERKLIEGYVENGTKKIAQEEKRLERVRKRQEREARLKAEQEAERKAQEEAAAKARADGNSDVSGDEQPSEEEE